MQKLYFRLVLLLFVLPNTLLAQQALPVKTSNGKISFHDVRTQQPVNNLLWDDAEDPVNGFFLVYKNGKSGFVRSNGQWLGNTLYDEVRNFHHQTAAVKMSDKWGFINTSGKLIVPAIYDIVFDFYNNVSAAQKNGTWYLLNSKGKIIAQPVIDQFYGFDHNVARVGRNGLNGLMDTLGNVYGLKAPVAGPKKPILARSVNLAFPCPPNIDFEEGSFNHWDCFIGNVDTIGSTNVITVTPSAPIPNRHRIIPRTNPSLLDPWGLFPINPPDGSNFALKLGNAINGAEAERVRYTIHVPAGITDFSLTYQYAVVFQDPGHTTWSQPRFEAKLFDSATNTYVNCSSFEYISTSGLPGFLKSPVDTSVLYKPWSGVFMNLSQFAGQTLYLEFTTADCARGAHWGYAYVDVNNCDKMAKAQNSCTSPQQTVLNGPPGFQTYNWWDSSYTTLLGTGQFLTLSPALPINTTIHVELIPFSGFGCTDTLHTTVTFSVPVADAGKDSTVCLGTSVPIGAPGFSGITYQWSPNYYLGDDQSSYTTANPPQDTTYVLTATDTATGCVAMDTVIIHVNKVDTTIIALGPLAFCTGGSVTLQGGAGISYQWYLNNQPISGATNQTYTATQAGNYSVNITDTSCSARTRSLTVTIYPDPVADFSVNNNPQCEGNNNFNFNNNSYISSGSYTSAWDFGDGNTSTQSNPSHQYAGNGTFTVWLVNTSNRGCVDSFSLPVTVYAKPTVTLNPNMPTSICSGNSVTLNAIITGLTGTITSYQWYQNNIAMPGETNPTLTVTASGSYYVEITTSIGCNTQSSATVITVNPRPVLNITAPANSFCPGGNVTLTATGGPSYQWYLNNQLIAGATNATYTATQAGAYYVASTNSFGCSSSSASFNVTISAVPVAGFSISNAGLCEGNNNFSFTDTSSISSGTYSTAWDFGDGQTSTQSNPTHSYATASNYNVQLTVTSNNGCSNSISQPVTVYPKPVLNISANGSPVICSGNSVTLTSTVSALNGTITSYQWYRNAVLMPGETNPTLTVNIPGNYYLIIQTSVGCSVQSPTLTVNVSQLPVVNITAPSANICPGGNVTLTANGAASYQWSFNNQPISGATSATYAATQTGIYTVSGTSAAGCTSNSTPVTVGSFPQPDAGFTYSNTAQCAGNNSFSFTDTSSISSGTYTTAWYFGDGQSSAQSNPTYSYSAPGYYNVKLIITSNNGCKDSASTIITVYNGPSLSINSNSSAAICSGDSVTLQANMNGVAGTISSFQWYLNGNAISGANGPSTIATTAGSYYVSIITSIGCNAQSTNYTVTVNPVPSGSITAPSANLCQGGTVTLTANGGNSYQWYFNNNLLQGATGSTYQANAAGTYTADIISAQGCKGKASNNFDLHLVKRPKADFEYDLYCVNTPIHFTNLSDTAGSSPLIWRWSFGDSSASLDYNPVHTYTGSGSFTVVLDIVPLSCPGLMQRQIKTINIASGNSGIRYPTVNALMNDPTPLHARNLGNNFIWDPSAGLNNAYIKDPIFNYDRETEYTVTISAASGCKVVDTVLVRVFKECGLWVPKAFSPNNDGKNDELYPLLVGIRELKYFKIYNRWGQLMFATSEQNKGWNGIFSNRQQPMEAYTWIVEAVCADGRVIKKSGNSILLR